MEVSTPAHTKGAGMIWLAIYIIGAIGSFIAAWTWKTDHNGEQRFGIVSVAIIAVFWPVFLVAGVMRKLMED